ncbi:MAG: GNAT family N-acetyltransferase [Maritimibacter sp.]
MKLDPVSTHGPIAADRLTLRPARKSDAGVLALYSGDIRVASNTASIPHPLPPGTTEAYLARVMAPGSDEVVWVLDGSTDLSEGRVRDVLGVISLTEMDRAQVELSYWVAPAFWNAGVASEAVRALVKANPLNSTTIFACVFQDNAASARVLTNAGFEYVGDAESFCVARGTTVPTWTYLLKLP